MQYKAGYFIHSIFDLFLNKVGKEKVEKIVNQLCHFELETSDKLQHQKVDYSSEIKVINNLLSRGTPTLPSTFIEDLFATTLGNTQRIVSNLNHINYPFKDDSLAEEIYRAIHIIDPRIKKENQFIDLEKEWKKKNSGYKLDFKYSLLPEYLGQEYIQLVEENRNYKSLIKSSDYNGSINALTIKFEPILEKNIDFLLEMPYQNQNGCGMSLELDDSPTETTYDYTIDQLKQKYCTELGFTNPLIIDTQQFADSNSLLKPLIDFTYNEYFDTVSKNYRSPIYKSTEGIKALQYALSPIAIARIEKTIIEYLLSGKLSLKNKNWEIAVIERDVPCAHLAIQDLKLHFEHLFALKGEEVKFPEIKLSIYRTAEFKGAQLNVIYPGTVKSIENFDEEANYDLLIDVSVLQRIGLINENYVTKAKYSAIIRSVRSKNAESQILTDREIQYLDLFSSKNDERLKDKARAALKYFVRNLFRKDVFLSGQLELINNALQRKNTLGLLPTGGGKTIAYQLACLLQPGVSFIINPIMSVMTDQWLGLKKTGIDKNVRINNSVKLEEELLHQFNLLENGNCLFAFISADFLRNKSLRNTIYAMEQNGVFINYFVIDEVHCFSEWSHDFRPSYAGIGALKRQLLNNNNKQKISTIALTATAGFACVNDVKKELQIDNESIVTAEQNQVKLSFRVIDTTSNQIKSDMDIDQIESLVGGRKQVHFSFLIKELFPEDSNADLKKDTLVFCPTPYGKTGVSDKFGDGLADKLKNNFEKIKIGTFWGTPDDGSDNVPRYDALLSEKNHIKFINNKLDVLIATKSFGIGINKSTIRNIIYFSPPSSMEAFIQQTYRSGRDGGSTNCTVVVERQEFLVPESDPVSKYLPNAKTNYDKYLSYREIVSKYQGKQKELTIIKEMLQEIDTPLKNYLEIIAHEIQNEFNLDIDLLLQPLKNPNRLYLNQEEKTYGFIDLSILNINSEESSFEQKLSNDLLLFVSEEIRKRINANNDYANNLIKNIYAPDKEGIRTSLEKLRTGGIKELVIPFENSGIQKISELLMKKISLSFNRKTIKNIYASSNSFDIFVKKINHIKSINKSEGIINSLSELYLKTRQKKDTKLAIYRLLRLGFIEDFLIDELNHQFIIKLKKKSNEAYLLKLYDIYDEYLLHEKSLELKMALSKTEGDEIDKAIEGYISFSYEFVVQERFNSIETLHEILRQIPENKSNSPEINQNIKGFFDTYFNAKYSNLYFSILPGVSPINVNTQDYGVIKKYLTHMGYLKENWIQLKKSIKLISERLPENYIPYLMDAYTNLINGEQDENLIDESFNQIARGFIRMRKQKGYQIENYNTDIQSFLEYLYENRSDLKEKYEPIIWLRLHYVWLKDFNRGLQQEALN